MDADPREIAASFDVRAATYGRSEWHRRSAERLVALCQLQPGSCVLDAGTGTGFAALAAAHAVGSKGRVCGVDISTGMLREARAAVEASALANIELVESDATRLARYGSGSFDAITCATGLLYMPVADALREWHRLLKPGGLVGFSTMKSGSPPAARIFRDCAAAFGVSLRDPSEPLGSVSACQGVLEAAGFTVADIVSEVMVFEAHDLAQAWESNFRSVAHAPVQRLSAEQQGALKEAYLEALAWQQREHPGVLSRAEILYALGRR
jgi:ubiquinone/menaquinone biosynthesis C-methylase UbiE